MRAAACLLACALTGARGAAADAPPVDGEAIWRDVNEMHAFLPPPTATAPPSRRRGVGALRRRMRRHRDALRTLRDARRTVDAVVARALGHAAPMTRATCRSVADQLQYSFFDDERIAFGFCIANHAGRTVQMDAAACESTAPAVECIRPAV